MAEIVVSQEPQAKKYPRCIVGICLLLAVLYVGGLFWGSHRLSMTAVRSLHNFKLFMKTSPIWVSDESSMSTAQREYLQQSISEASQRSFPQIQVNVKWDVFAVARIKVSGSSGPGERESNDAIFVCLFGMWIQLYSFGHSIACG